MPPNTRETDIIDVTPTNIHCSDHDAIVLIPGFLSPRFDTSGGSKGHCTSYWGGATRLGTASSPVLSVSPSGVGSLHDRACEIFYQLVGGTVDYGKEHSDKHGHARYGRTYDVPLLPSWSRKKPIHLVGHSFGGCTAVHLRYLLESGFFADAGYNTTGWVRSVTTLSAPLQGALAVYGFGAKVTKGKGERSEVIPFSIGFFLGCFVHLYEALNIQVLKTHFYDFGMDHWNMGVASALKSVFVRSAMFEGKDCANYDMTCHAMMAHSKTWATQKSDNCYFISFVAQHDRDEDCRSDSDAPSNGERRLPRKFGQKKKGCDDACCASQTWLGSMWALLWYALVAFGGGIMWLIHHHTMRNIARILECVQNHIDMGFHPEKWMCSGTDGLVNCDSQAHPYLSDGTTPNYTSTENEVCGNIEPGKWNVHSLNTHHLGVVPFPSCRSTQTAFFEKLFATLRSLPVPEKR